MAGTSGKAPKSITWIICLVLYLIALIGHFGPGPIPANFALWSWIIGFGLLLLAVKVKGL